MGSLADAALRMELEDQASRQSNPRVFREYDTAIAGLSTRNKELLAALRKVAEFHLPDCPASMDETAQAKEHIMRLRKIAADALK